MDYPDAESGLQSQLIEQVTLLLAVCDIVTPLEHYEELRSRGWARAAAADDAAEFGKGVHWVVQEVAHTRSGLVLALREELGWSGRLSSGSAADMWRHISAASITRDVLNVVLPDDTEESADPHPYARFMDSLATAGIKTTENDLRKIPYHVVFAPRLLRRLRPPLSPPPTLETIEDVDAIDPP
jgi:hypothetical protein